MVSDRRVIVQKTANHRGWRKQSVLGEASDHYERQADHYDDNWAYSDWAVDWTVAQILRRLELGPDDHAVDLGCGTDLFSAGLARYARDVTCVDSVGAGPRLARPLAGRRGTRSAAETGKHKSRIWGDIFDCYFLTVRTPTSHQT